MAKAKVDLSITESKIDRFVNLGLVAIADTYKKGIIQEIEGGRSPVKRKGRFQKYSDSYLKAIESGRFENKRKRPVNLKLSGDLLKSLQTFVRNKILIIRFDNSLADIHNRRGAGKSKVVRRMLPTESGETFNESIQRDVREVLKRLASKIFKTKV